MCILLATGVAVGCGGGSDDATSGTTSAVATTESRPSSSTTEPTTSTTAAKEVARPPAGTWLTVRSAAAVPVYAEPEAGKPVRVLAARTGFGSPLALLVVKRQAGWHQVLIPGRPNGATGWVRADDVAPRRVDYEVRVDLGARKLTLLRRGQVALSTKVAIGDAGHPTPTGRFSITDKLATGNSGGTYGPYALGISARSEVLTEFAGGDGQVGIHGTNNPSGIGQAISHGCIRVPNDVVTQLTEVLPLGTPVVIT